MLLHDLLLPLLLPLVISTPLPGSDRAIGAKNAGTAQDACYKSAKAEGYDPEKECPKIVSIEFGSIVDD